MVIVLSCALLFYLFFFFFFNDTATTEIYTLSLHDALPISDATATTRRWWRWRPRSGGRRSATRGAASSTPFRDRKSTRLNSSHLVISYAVFCLKKKKKKNQPYIHHQREMSTQVPVPTTPPL